MVQARHLAPFLLTIRFLYRVYANPNIIQTETTFLYSENLGVNIGCRIITVSTKYDYFRSLCVQEITTNNLHIVNTLLFGLFNKLQSLLT